MSISYLNIAKEMISHFITFCLEIIGFVVACKSSLLHLFASYFFCQKYKLLSKLTIAFFQPIRVVAFLTMSTVKARVFNATSSSTSDFSTLYTTLPHNTTAHKTH